MGITGLLPRVAYSIWGSILWPPLYGNSHICAVDAPRLPIRTCIIIRRDPTPFPGVWAHLKMSTIGSTGGRTPNPKPSALNLSPNPYNQRVLRVNSGMIRAGAPVDAVLAEFIGQGVGISLLWTVARLILRRPSLQSP